MSKKKSKKDIKAERKMLVSVINKQKKTEEKREKINIPETIKATNVRIKNLNPRKRPISAVADNVEFRNAKFVTIKTNKKIKFNLLYDSNRSLQKKIKIEQIRKETN